MNQGAVRSSPTQQMVAAGGPTCWSINNIRPPPLYHHHPFLAAPPPPHLLSPSPVAPPWNDDGGYGMIIPESCSQLLLGGLVGGDDHKPAGLRTLENWEQQLLNLTSNVDVIKQENSASNCAGGHGNVEFQGWSNQMVPASSPKSCVTTLSNNMADFSPKSSDLKHPKQDPSSECNSIGTTAGGAAKKARIQPPSVQSTFKVRKEKLGDRITALHQLVSPFGKTDTASVLLEAIGYIRFLQSQIEALSLPYLGDKSASLRQHLPESDEEPKNDLRSRGLCLVPISCTLQVGSDNGADYWAPAFGANFR